jgi:hypothetical protein
MTTPQFYPYYNIPNAITRAYPCVVTLVNTVNYVVNEIVGFRCPSNCGMPQINKQTARIISVNAGANTITVDLDTSSFDTFVYSTNPQSPEVVPAGEIDTLGAAVRDNSNRPGYTPV